MPEQYANTVSTTLASGYTAGSGSIVVASATGLPSTGDFAVSLQNAQKTILKCTARSGTTLTVTAEANDANAASGTVVLATMLSARNLSLLMQEPGVDSPYIVTPSFTRGLVRRVYPVDPTLFAWTNQGGATETTTNGFPYLQATTQNSNSIRIRRKAAPSTPYTVTAAFQARILNLNFFSAGILLRESATGKLEYINLASAAASVGINVTTCTDENNVVAHVYTYGIFGSGGFGDLYWFRVGNDGTNLTYAFSENGYNFQVFTSTRAKNTFFTTGPDQVGYAINANNITLLPYAMSLYSWREA